MVKFGEEHWRGYSFGFVNNILKHGPGQGVIGLDTKKNGLGLWYHESGLGLYLMDWTLRLV